MTWRKIGLMSARPVVTTQEIVNALLAWRGNIEAAAHELGVRRNSLYERIGRLGLDLDGFRRSDAKQVTPFAGVQGVSGLSGLKHGNKDTVRDARKGDAPRFPKNSHGSRLGTMEAAEQDERPIKTVTAQQRPIRLRPAHRDRLREAKLDFTSRFRLETDENLILEQFFEEQFEAWSKAKLGVKARVAGK